LLWPPQNNKIPHAVIKSMPPPMQLPSSNDKRWTGEKKLLLSCDWRSAKCETVLGVHGSDDRLAALVDDVEGLLPLLECVVEPHRCLHASLVPAGGEASHLPTIGFRCRRKQIRFGTCLRSRPAVKRRPSAHSYCLSPR
jgi:hypothetical protein